jgi:hypothetical protein
MPRSYTFWIDIGSWSTPVTGGGFVQGNPIFNNTSLLVREEKKDIFARVTFEGSLNFEGDESATLKTLADTYEQIDFQVRLNNQVIHEGYLNLRKDYNVTRRNSDHDVSTNDQFTVLIDNKSVKKNVLGNTDEYEVKVPIAFNKLTFYTAPKNFGDVAWLTHSGNNTYAYEEVEYPEDQADNYIGSNGWFLIAIITNLNTGEVTKLIGRNWTAGGYPSISWPPTGNVYLYPELSSTSGLYPLNDRKVRGGGSFTVEERTMCMETQSGLNDVYLWLSDDYYRSTSITYKWMRRLDETIKYLIGKLDSTIKFDAQSFAYWDSHPYLANLMIGAISDMVVSGTPPVQGTNKATIGNLALDQLFGWLSSYPWQFFWTLEKILGDYYFRIKHISEVNKALGSNPDLTNLQSINWTEQKTAYSYQAIDKYNRIHREYVAEDPNFIGVDVEIPSIVTDQIREISMQDFYFDIQEIYTNSGKYNADSNDAWVILSADVYTGAADYICRVGTGLLTGSDRANMELSLANLDPVLGIYELPESSVLINGNPVTVGIVKRRFTQAMEVPIWSPKEVNFEELFKTDLANTEGVTLSIPMGGQMPKIVTKF